MFSNYSQPFNPHRDVAILRKRQKFISSQLQRQQAFLELDVGEVVIGLVIREDPAAG